MGGTRHASGHNDSSCTAKIWSVFNNNTPIRSYFLIIFLCMVLLQISVVLKMGYPYFTSVTFEIPTMGNQSSWLEYLNSQVKGKFSGVRRWENITSLLSIHSVGDAESTRGARVGVVKDNSLQNDNSVSQLLKVNISVSQSSNVHCNGTQGCRANNTGRIYTKFAIPEDMTPYVAYIGPIKCLIEGTNMTKTLQPNVTACQCLPHWFGEHCSIPLPVYKSQLPITQYKLRNKPRKIVQGFPFNNEWAMLDYRLLDTASFVDAFVILESNYTAYGDPRNLTLLEHLRSGMFSKELTAKIVHVFLDYFPKLAVQDGWVFDALSRNFIGEQGIRKQLTNFSNDDIFIINDADEVPSKEVLLFLKIHDNFPEPFGIVYKKNTYGFFWDTNVNELYAGATFNMVRKVYKDQVYHIRKGGRYWSHYGVSELLHAYIMSNNSVRPWYIGSSAHPGGFHCSWCSHPEGIQNKLISAQNGDFPRWGDYPEKCNISFIKTAVGSGMWFGEESCFKPANNRTPNYAPRFFLKHNEKYKYLLENPYKANAVTCVPRSQYPERIYLKNWHRMSKKQLAVAMERARQAKLKRLAPKTTVQAIAPNTRHAIYKPQSQTLLSGIAQSKLTGLSRSNITISNSSSASRVINGNVSNQLWTQRPRTTQNTTRILSQSEQDHLKRVEANLS